VSPKRYSYLIEHMDKPDNKRTNFETYNRIFWHYLKIREIEDMDDIKDIYVERLLPPSLKETIEAEEKQKLMEEIQNEGINEGVNEGITRHDKLPDDFLEQNEDDGDDVPF
ncbi:MAG: hypothetical protein PQJ49_01055, partial [Sphaerochaetaceae bacterium]|nr:hypothetical protein [Sphaerochaetaceae bacterium]